MQYTIERIAAILKARHTGPLCGNTVSRLLTDSRSLGFPEETLFFAIKTKHGDGHRFVEELHKRGVRNFVVENEEVAKDFPDANFIMVDNSVKALQLLATHHRKQFDIPVVGVTGSDGKTTLIGAAAIKHIKIHDLIRQTGFEITVTHGQLVKVAEHGQIRLIFYDTHGKKVPPYFRNRCQVTCQ